MSQFETSTGQNILQEEVENVTHQMKNGKGTGPDGFTSRSAKVTG